MFRLLAAIAKMVAATRHATIETEYIGTDIVWVAEGTLFWRTGCVSFNHRIDDLVDSIWPSPCPSCGRKMFIEGDDLWLCPMDGMIEAKAIPEL
jgi:hypothetical protein